MGFKVQRWLRMTGNSRVDDVKRAAVKEWATYTQRQIQANARYHEGDLRRSIRVRDTSTAKTMRYSVYSKNRNARWENFGTGIYNEEPGAQRGRIYPRNAPLLIWNSYKFPFLLTNPWRKRSIRGKPGNKFWSRGVEAGRQKWLQIQKGLPAKIKAAMKGN